MICYKCNKTIGDSALFCGFCGAQLKPVQHTGIARPEIQPINDFVKPNEVNQPDQPRIEFPKSKSNNLIWIIISSVVAIIILSYIVFEKYITESQSGHQQADTTSLVQNKALQVDETGSNPSVSDQTLPKDNIQPAEKETTTYTKSQQSDYSGQSANAQNTSLAENSETKHEDAFSVSSTEKDASIKNHELTEEKILTFIPNMPFFLGGNEALVRYIRNNIRYPLNAQESGIQGIVYTSFVVETDGSLSAIRILKGIGGGCDEEAIRLIKAMPNWIPGKQADKPVRVQYNLPMKFSL
ncbi:MAG: energy transducer TonB [Bacteroidales bacterium]|nr:energy transducer TonB [Bacteroidales bacterium]